MSDFTAFQDCLACSNTSELDPTMAGVSISAENTDMGDFDDVPKTTHDNHPTSSVAETNNPFSAIFSWISSRYKKPSSSQLCIPPYYSSPNIKGVVNLGNTCYLGSVLQCLNQTVEVFKLLTDAVHPSDHLICENGVSADRINVAVNRRMGPLGKVLYDFFVEMNCDESRSVVKPTKVLSTIRQCDKMYQGRHPQDSHEVFRTILDSIRNEECGEIKQAIYNHFGVTTKSLKQKDEDTQKKINAYLRQAQKHCELVKGVFGGKMINIIICRECSTVITIEEDFFDLSIPIKRVVKIANCYNHNFEISTPEQHMKIEGSVHTDTGHSVSSSEVVELNKSTDSLQNATADMSGIPSTIKLTKPNGGSPTVTDEHEAMRQHHHSGTAVPSDDNGVCDGDSNSSVASVQNNNSSSGVAAAKFAEYTINESLLQLHLKKENIPYRNLRSDVDTDLEAGLQAYFELDILDEHNKFMSDVCATTKTEEQGHGSSAVGLCEISKQLSIISLPEILVIHMKRFNFGQQKSSKIISFPLILNMAPYCTNTCLEKFADFSQRILYGLYGVVEHRGTSVSGGHYVAYVRRRSKRLEERSSKRPSDMVYDEEEAKNKDWFFVDDRQVRKLRGGFEDIKNCQAYMLFYEKISMIDSSLFI